MRAGHNSCNIRTIYNTTFNCEIISKESICFPEGNKFAAITIEVSPPGRQVNAKEPAAIPSLPSRPVNVEYVGVSMEWSKIDHVISRIAKYPSNVLIQGESGTGKEVVARTIHNLSGRSGNFVAINCGDIPEGLLQSEFFGYEKGSFTGANREGRMGKFEYADHGTVFLDEIGDMPLSMQVSLLRFIQERTVQRIGSNQTKPVDVRIVAATNKNIEEMIKNQLFRNDLYYRLNIIGITLPPLRDRKDDIPVLAQYFAKSISSQYGLPVPEIDPGCLQHLQPLRLAGQRQGAQERHRKAANHERRPEDNRALRLRLCLRLRHLQRLPHRRRRGLGKGPDSHEPDSEQGQRLKDRGRVRDSA